MDDDTKRRFKVAVDAEEHETVGRLLVAEVRLPVKLFKAGAYSTAHGRFTGLIKDETAEKYEIAELDKALVKSADRQVIKRERTDAEVGAEVCALISLAKGWTPLKGVASSGVTRDAKRIAKLVRNLINEIDDYNSRYQDGPAVLTSGQAMSQDEILESLKLIQARFGSEVMDYVVSLQPSQMLSVKDFIEQVICPVYESLFRLKGGKLGRAVNNYPERGDQHVGAFVRFGRAVVEAADKPISDSTLYNYAKKTGVKRKKSA